MTPKRFVLLITKGPFGSSTAAEGIDVALATSVFDQTVSVIFMDDGVYQLLEGNTEDFAMKDYRKNVHALAMYGIDNVLVESESLSDRGITQKQIMANATSIDRTTIQDVIRSANVILKF